MKIFLFISLISVIEIFSESKATFSENQWVRYYIFENDAARVNLKYDSSRKAIFNLNEINAVLEKLSLPKVKENYKDNFKSDYSWPSYSEGSLTIHLSTRNKEDCIWKVSISKKK